MNRLVCPRDKIDLGNAFFEWEERSSRTQVGHAYGVVNNEPRTSSEQSGDIPKEARDKRAYFWHHKATVGV